MFATAESSALCAAQPSAPFCPSPIDLQAILFKLISPDYDLADIACCHKVNLVVLMDWLETPEVVELVKRLDRHVRRKARLAARAAAPLVIRSLRRTLKAFHREEAELEASIEASDPRTRSAFQDPKAHERRIRAREIARKASSLLQRIAAPPSRHSKRQRPLAGKDHLGLDKPIVPQAAFQDEPSSVIQAKVRAAPHPAPPSPSSSTDARSREPQSLDSASTSPTATPEPAAFTAAPPVVPGPAETLESAGPFSTPPPSDVPDDPTAAEVQTQPTA